MRLHAEDIIAIFYHTISGATYQCNDGMDMTVASGRYSPDAFFVSDYGSSHYYVGCTVTINDGKLYVYMMVEINCKSPSNIYPNPVSNILKIDTEIYDNTRGIKTNPTLDIRLYDGTYYLHTMG